MLDLLIRNDWRALVVASRRSAPDLKAHEVSASLRGAAIPGAPRSAG